MATFDTRRDTFPGQALPAARSFGPAGSRDERVKRVLRVLGITMSQFKKRFSKGRQTVTEADLAKAERAAAVVGTEYKTKKVDYDAHFGGTGTKLAQPIEVANKLDNDANDLAYRLKRFKRELNQSIDSRTRLRDVERTGTLPESTRPVQLVRECSTAGPGWSYCDRTVEGQCPDEKDIVGTPYENVYSSIGDPPNNKIVQCVPAELIRLGKNAKTSEEEDLNRRLYRAVEVISKESENMKKLSQWREVAPCGAIPAMAFAKNDAMCDRLHFKDDRGIARCMTWNTAAKNPSLDQAQKEIADLAKKEPALRTCFSNPAEVTQKLQEYIRGLTLLRHKLRDAVERAMQVNNFSTRFDMLATRLAHKYYNHNIASKNNAQIPYVPFSWDVVKAYILSADDLNDSSKTNVPDCDKTKKEFKELKEAMGFRLGGGGTAEEEDGGDTFPEPPSMQGGGGAPTFTMSGCGDDNHCGERLRYVLQLMHRITEKERAIKTHFAQWKLAQEHMLSSLEKDTMCNKQAANPSWCKDMQDQCNYECTQIENVQDTCIKIGNEWVDKANQDITWQVDDFSADGHPIGFRWKVTPDVRRLYNDFKDISLYTCNSTGRLSKQEHKELKDAYKQRVKGIETMLHKHYPDSVRKAFKRRAESAAQVDEEQHAMQQANIETMMAQVAQAAAERALQGVHVEQARVAAAMNADDDFKKETKAAAMAGNLEKLRNLMNTGRMRELSVQGFVEPPETMEISLTNLDDVKDPAVRKALSESFKRVETEVNKVLETPSEE